MAGELLPIEPDEQVSASLDSASVSTTQLGDGYVQAVEKGINSDGETYRLSYRKRRWADVSTLKAFFAAHRAVYFTWAPPGSATVLKFRCDSYETPSSEFSSGLDQALSVWALSAVIKRTFDI